jgi:hypothetical protein
VQTDSVSISLTSDEALVLFEWLTQLNKAEGEFADQAEQRVLWDLQAQLESSLAAPLRPDYNAVLAAARDRIRDSTN